MIDQEEIERCNKAQEIVNTVFLALKDFNRFDAWQKRNYPNFGGNFTSRSIDLIEIELTSIQRGINLARKIANGR